MTEVSKEIAEAVWKAADDGKNATQIAINEGVSPSTVSRLIRVRKAFQKGHIDGEIAPKIGWEVGGLLALVRQWQTAYDATRSQNQKLPEEREENHRRLKESLREAKETALAPETRDKEGNEPPKAASGEELRTSVRKAIDQVVSLSPHEFAIQALLDHEAWFRKTALVLEPAPDTPQFNEAVRRHMASLGCPISGVVKTLTPYKDALPVACWGSIEKWEEAFGRYFGSTLSLLAAVVIASDDLLEGAIKTVVDEVLTSRGEKPLAAFSLKNPYQRVSPERRDGKTAMYMAILPDPLAAELFAELLARVASERPSQGIWAVELMHLRSLKERAHLSMSLSSPTPIKAVDIDKVADYFWTIPEDDDHWKLRPTATEAGVAFEEVSKTAMQAKEHLAALLQ